MLWVEKNLRRKITMTTRALLPGWFLPALLLWNARATVENAGLAREERGQSSRSGRIVGIVCCNLCIVSTTCQSFPYVPSRMHPTGNLPNMNSVACISCLAPPAPWDVLLTVRRAHTASTGSSSSQPQKRFHIGVRRTKASDTLIICRVIFSGWGIVAKARRWLVEM